MNINELINLPAAKLKQILALKAQIETLQAQLSKLLTGSSSAPAAKAGAKATAPKQRKMSAAARRKISLAAKARWAKVKAGKGK
jgi:hypothetical protein